MHYLIKTILVIALLLASCGDNNRSVPEITAEDLTMHISFLASEQLQGRLPGSDGDLAAAEYFRKIEEAGNISEIMSVSVFANMIIFLVFNRLDMLRASKGVLGITIIWAFAVFGIKLF